VYKMPNLNKKVKKYKTGEYSVKGSKLDKIIYSIVAMQMNNSNLKSNFNVNRW
jgi:hypothetical protein